MDRDELAHRAASPPESALWQSAPFQVRSHWPAWQAACLPGPRLGLAQLFMWAGLPGVFLQASGTDISK